MLLTITCEGPHAADFGFLLHKHPASVFERETAYGRLTLFYTESDPERATVALICDVDPVALVRGEHRAAALDQYVNDRPYVASSLMSVALREAFSSALGGKSKDRPELVAERLPLRARVPAVNARGGAAVVERLFCPLGYDVTITPIAVDSGAPAAADTELLSFAISGAQTVHDLLSHLYVLLPVLDATKHYYIADDEVDKLLEHGRGWLGNHPEKVLISNRYLKHRRSLVREAISQLTPDQPAEDAEEQEREDALEGAMRLHDLRIAAVMHALEEANPPVRRLIDMGCGEGKLLGALLDSRQFAWDELVGVDVSPAMLTIAEKRLRVDQLPIAMRDRIKLILGSVLYRDRRLAGYDAMTLVEVIEHIDEDRLDVARKVIFRDLRPGRVIITTPNVEYNARLASLPPGQLRHVDHRFEWTRAQFRSWCEGARAYQYEIQYRDVGPGDAEVGPPTQMAVFDRDAS